jgi:hypothetical protein
MDLEQIKSLLEGFDIAAFLPELDTVMGWVEMLLRIAVMAGPLLLLGFGLLYLVAPPKEANHGLGFRCWWGMASLQAWQFTQKIAGLVWSALGVILTIVMAVICNAWKPEAPMEMVWSAVSCLLCEIGLVFVSCIGIYAAVIICFDKYGFRREWGRKE